jgi:Uma2 family endonuclease
MIPRLLKGPFTVGDYHRMAETGVLRQDVRVELLDGQVALMSPIGSPHAGCVNRLTQMLALATAGRATVGIQNPVVLDDFSEPQPDVAVLKYRSDGYAERHPRPADVLVLIEVTVTSACIDRDVKLPLYARAGVPEVWLVDLEADTVEIYREPARDGYALVRTATRDDALVPLHLATVTLSGADILG